MTDLADSNAVYYYHFDGLGSLVPAKAGPQPEWWL